MEDWDNMEEISIDNQENADWTKTTWDLPPYKSKEFFDEVGNIPLNIFRASIVYKSAVKKGLIFDDEWIGQ